MGVNIIEAGSAITSPGEREGIKKITSEGLSAEICSFARAVQVDIDAALDCDVDSVHLVVPTSDLHMEHKLRKTREEVLQQAIESTQYAVDHGLIVELSAEDSTRSDIDFLVDIEEGKSLFDLSGFMEEVESLIGYKIDVAIRSDLKPSMGDEIMKEAVDL